MATLRGYLTQEELAEFADITINDATEADDRISQAEELIDSFVGPQNKDVSYGTEGRCSAGGSSTFTLDSDGQNAYDQDVFIYCVAEIIGGTGSGQKRRITGNTKAGVVTVVSAFSPALDTTSIYKIYQLGKFPRQQDSYLHSKDEPYRFYKSVPEAVKRATAAQVQFMIEMGDGYFAGDKSDMQSESIGDYSYSKGSGKSGIASLVAPRAKILLRGILNRTGELIP